MKRHRGWGFRGTLLAAASGICATTGTAQAQTGTATPAPGADLRQQLSDLAANPQSVNELLATGRAALALGDAQGALGFFTRAEQLAANDARVKAGMAAANVRIGRPETALTLFAEAIAAGAPVNDLLADRGLAYDMIGQTARAQQDYVASLRHRDDAEVRRRLAVSLAISGQREAALRVIEPQIRNGDRAGQRARIMVLALSGDARGATAAANGALNAQQAGALAPFLTRLASLPPGDMAAAANLGRVPGTAAVRQASARAEADPGALAFAGGGASALPARLPVALAAASTPRRRPGGVTSNASAPGVVGSDRNAAARNAGTPRGGWTEASSTTAVRRPAVTGASTASVAATILQPHPHEPLRINGVAADQPILTGASAQGEPRVPAARVAEADVTQPVVSAQARPVQLAAAQPEPEPAPIDAQAEPEEEGVDGAAANLAVWNSSAAPARIETTAPAPVRSAPVQSAPVQNVTRRETPAAAPAGPAFSDVVAAVSALPVETPTVSAPRPTPPAAARTSPSRSRASTPATPTPARAGNAATRTGAGNATTTPARAGNAATRTGNAATRTGAAATRAAAPRQAHPARIWVQLGVSNNRAGFGYEMTRMRRLAPELSRQTAHTAPIGSNNHRLLVGPFPTDAAARAFVNTLRSKDIQSMAWTSSAGTEVTRLPAGR